MSSKPWILVVDDELSVRDSLQAWFKEEGYGVESAASGKEALERMARQEFDIYLLDIRMAGMDGLELQHRIREIKPDAAVIIMTAYASVETAVQALKEGAFDYITKPFDPDDLEHLVRNAAERQSLQRENAALKRNHLEIAGMRSTFSLTNLHGSVTSCLNDVPAKGLDERAARNLQVDDCVCRGAQFRTRSGKSGHSWILARNRLSANDPKRTFGPRKP